VNPSARSICGVKAFATLSLIPETIDLAIIAVPPIVWRRPRRGASVGVRAVTVITAGFAETGRSGAQAETELLKVARRHGCASSDPTASVS